MVIVIVVDGDLIVKVEVMVENGSVEMIVCLGFGRDGDGDGDSEMKVVPELRSTETVISAFFDVFLGLDQ